MSYTVTLTLENVLTQMVIDNNRLHLYGVIREVTTGKVLKEFHEDVTDQLPANYVTGLNNLVTKATEWVDSRVL